MFQTNNKLNLYVLASLLFGAKTYIIYRFFFNIDIENFMQEIILFINPFATAFLILGVSVWFKEKHQIRYIKYAMIFGTLILYFNILFYRNFGDFLTFPVLFQGSNAADLGSSILALVEPFDLIVLADLIAIWWITKRDQLAITVSFPKKKKLLVLSVSFVFLLGNYVLAEIERPQLLQRGFDREYLVKNIGLFNFHVYDVIQHSRSRAQRVFADGNELSDILSYVDEHTTDNEETDMYGIAEDKNVIFVTLESLQSFVINNELHGEEITPFLNELIDDSYYFENFYHQTEQGKTADSEFIMETSLYPLPSGSAYFTHSSNEFLSTPQMLAEEDYTSAVFHANNASFWNRNSMYDNLDVDHFYDIDAYEVTDDNSVGWGMKDKEFFEQSMKYLTSLPEPYYARFITLTNHHPFDLDEEDATIDKFDSNSRTLNQYFQTVRYMDEAIEEFFDHLKAEGIYEDSLIVMMGDHYGISDFHDRAMAQYLEKDEITPYDHIQLQRVPFYIHMPGHEGEVISDISGQVDVKPTLMHLLGIDDSHDVSFGTNLFGSDRKEYIALRDGSFITDDYIYTRDTCYDRESGEVEGTESTSLIGDEVDSTETPCGPMIEQVEQEMSYSDKLIYGDLFRFHDFETE
ncbi:Phosphoglycerol transferase MdoB [Pelagirhabdus alkalitolerans]|uniref:Phosphoglycerol transferase MdoB n=1 Tax=Pelagirhabdus alkalitolerans TaxID=1612202 RepID=A0A1G6I0L4_9BACI|nr:LTA synthase family protein [Pelagirhabdus alkalitolerans]SDB99286.1 Phosphoglycerol transferase MdoB [Pelagirhabdus alkalitolerans]